MATNYSNNNISAIKLQGKEYNIKSTPFHGTEEEWLINNSYIPKQGEIVIYDIDSNYDYERIKVGDGVTVVANLPFYLASEMDEIQEKIKNLDKMLDVEVDNNLGILIFSKPLSI